VVVGVGGIVGVGNLTKICTNLWPPLIASSVEHFRRFIGGGFLDVDARVKQPWFAFPFSQPSSLWPPGCPSVVRRIDGLPGQPTPLPVVRVIGRSIHLQSDPADFAARIFHAHLSRDLFEFFVRRKGSQVAVFEAETLTSFFRCIPIQRVAMAIFPSVRFDPDVRLSSDIELFVFDFFVVRRVLRNYTASTLWTRQRSWQFSFSTLGPSTYFLRIFVEIPPSLFPIWSVVAPWCTIPLYDIFRSLLR